MIKLPFRPIEINGNLYFIQKWDSKGLTAKNVFLDKNINILGCVRITQRWLEG